MGRRRWALWAVMAGLPLLLALPLLVILYGALSAPPQGGERLQDVIGLVAVLALMALFYLLVARGRRGT
jgi:hypothetical protein